MLARVAENCPDRMFALLVVRPHPGDPNKDEYLQAVTRSTPANMKIVLASNSEVSMQEAGYAADVVVMTLGTEGFYAPLRGKQSAFLALEEPGLGGQLWRNNYDEDMIQVLAGGESPRFIKTQDQLAEYFIECHRAPTMSSVNQSAPSKSVGNILNIVLS